MGRGGVCSCKLGTGRKGETDNRKRENKEEGREGGKGGMQEQGDRQKEGRNAAQCMPTLCQQK